MSSHEGPATMLQSQSLGLRILLVEDNVFTLRFLGEMLRSRGYIVHPAASLRDARQVAAAFEFDVLLSDIELPDGSGLELVRELAPRGVAAIALSGLGSEDDIRSSLEAGFQEHLTKPLEVRQLECALDRAASRGAI